ncbi:hypothetical protein [Pseudodonghicola flavimaris]|uniref:Tail assembly chaperone n=1 Tax=Pseudodonghicola flavimaris TaxID=3050036 RepID=A0ABT7EZ43_9RHOB|nr:hypothetical protein [Pseudodonghicola flavimaris]MDK3017626.1 hypothetical protein [Pseudodonghicola flavimaris]
MISTVTVKLGKKTHKLKVSIRAQVRLEKDLGKEMGDILEQLFRGEGGVSLVVQVWAACLNDGAGVELEEAMDVLDAIGGANAGSSYMTEALQSAFPFLNPDETAAEDEAEEAGNATV